MMAHVSKPKSDVFFRSNTIVRTISWDFMLKQVFHVLKMTDPPKYWTLLAEVRFLCDGLCFCQWNGDVYGSVESFPISCSQVPMTDPWCCYIWCAMDPINTPPINVSMCTSTMDPMG